MRSSPRSRSKEFAVYVRGQLGDVPVGLVAVIAAQDADEACGLVQTQAPAIEALCNAPWQFRESPLGQGQCPRDIFADVAHEVLRGTVTALRGNRLVTLADGTPLVAMCRTSKALRRWHELAYERANATAPQSAQLWPTR